MTNPTETHQVVTKNHHDLAIKALEKHIQMLTNRLVQVENLTKLNP